MTITTRELAELRDLPVAPTAAEERYARLVRLLAAELGATREGLQIVLATLPRCRLPLLDEHGNSRRACGRPATHALNEHMYVCDAHAPCEHASRYELPYAALVRAQETPWPTT